MNVSEIAITYYDNINKINEVIGYLEGGGR